MGSCLRLCDFLQGALIWQLSAAAWLDGQALSEKVAVCYFLLVAIQAAVVNGGCTFFRSCKYRDCLVKRLVRCALPSYCLQCKCGQEKRMYECHLTFFFTLSGWNSASLAHILEWGKGGRGCFEIRVEQCFGYKNDKHCIKQQGLLLEMHPWNSVSELPETSHVFVLTALALSVAKLLPRTK